MIDKGRIITLIYLRHLGSALQARDMVLEKFKVGVEFSTLYFITGYVEWILHLAVGQTKA